MIIFLLKQCKLFLYFISTWKVALNIKGLCRIRDIPFFIVTGFPWWNQAWVTKIGCAFICKMNLSCVTFRSSDGIARKHFLLSVWVFSKEFTRKFGSLIEQTRDQPTWLAKCLHIVETRVFSHVKLVWCSDRSCNWAIFTTYKKINVCTRFPVIKCREGKLLIF